MQNSQPTCVINHTRAKCCDMCVLAGIRSKNSHGKRGRVGNQHLPRMHWEASGKQADTPGDTAAVATCQND